jgi:hypothetical protein
MAASPTPSTEQAPTPLRERHAMRRFLLVREEGGFCEDEILAEGLKWSDGRVSTHDWCPHGLIWTREDAADVWLPEMRRRGYRIVWCDDGPEADG